MGLMISCEKEQLSLSHEIDHYSNLEMVDYLGIKIILQNGLTEVDVNNYILNQNSEIEFDAKNLRTNLKEEIDWSVVSMEDLLKMISENFNKYPDLSKENFSDEDMVKISKDIPSIKTKNDAKMKKSVVSDYYNMLVIKDLDKLLPKKSKNGKTNGARIRVDYGTATEFEKQKAKDDPLAGMCFGSIAKGEAETITNDVFNEYLDDGEKNNAFKHAAWNAIGIQELAQRTLNKWTSLNRIKKLACAHEYVLPTGSTTWELGNDISHAMDLHNNLVGRTYMYRTVTTGFLGIAGNIPSDTKIRDDMKDFSFTKRFSTTEILSLSSSYNWYNLGNFENAMNYHTPTEKNFSYILD